MFCIDQRTVVFCSDSPPIGDAAGLLRLSWQSTYDIGMNTRKHIETELVRASKETQAVIAHASRRNSDHLRPLPLVSRRSLRTVLTMDGNTPLVRHDADGNARMSAWGYLLIALAMAFSVAVMVGVWRMFNG